MCENVLLYRAYQCSEELKNEIKTLCDLRRNTISELNTIARELHKVHLDVNITKTVGSSVGIVGGVLSITGLVLTPFTAGASLALTTIGSGVAAAGGLTTTGGVIAEKIISSEKLSKAQDALEADAAQVKRVQERFKEFEELCEKIAQILEAERESQETDSSEDHTVWRKLKEAWKWFAESKVERAVLFIWNIISFGKNFYRAVTAAWDVIQIILVGVEQFAANYKQGWLATRLTKLLGSTGYLVFDRIFQVIGLAIDIYTLVTTIIDMTKGSKSEAALELEKKAKTLEREEQMWREAFLEDH